jgi:hypothetical protein
MAHAKAVSLSRFTATVHAAVKAAVLQHPKFKLDTPQGVEFSYLIRGIPVPEVLLANATFAETQAFANAVAANIVAAQPEAVEERVAGAQGNGVIYSTGGHILIGIPPLTSLRLEQ